MTLPKPSLAIVGIAATLLGGGLAGAVLNNWVNRPKTTVVSYSLSSATIADTESGSIIPELKVQIGDQDVRNLYTHAIVLSVTKGPQIDSGEVAIDFPPSTKFFGEPGISTPSPVHRLDCNKIQSGLVCRLSPVRRDDKLPPFRVSIATDEKADPDLVTSTKGLELQAAAETLTAASKKATYLQFALAILTLLMAATGLVLVLLGSKRIAAREAEFARREARRESLARWRELKDQQGKLTETLLQRFYAAQTKKP